ncbi:protein turtle [Nilaparvata lugens]|uniref:protein turtle n=1 Tax=Nilaparvata lugens TaxID=108931 RepID=UPI00193E39EA|nr:protein turtle [Nilaparvata lugens]
MGDGSVEGGYINGNKKELLKKRDGLACAGLVTSRGHVQVHSTETNTSVPLPLQPLLFSHSRSDRGFQDAVHITAILGESVVFNCPVEFPADHAVPYVLQWEKKGVEIPIYIWYDSYPTHSGEGYEGRVSRVAPDSHYGLASLNLTNIRETDQGWYECKVVFLNRSPNSHKNGTWFHLDVHAPPRFSVTPDDIIYVNLGDAIILNCQAEGTPKPEILWYKDANPVEPSGTIGIFNDGTELRISNIRHEDIGDYTCIARNGEGQISHTARVIIAGGAVIMVPPTNQTKLEGEKVQFSCEAKALPGNVTVRWTRESTPVKEVAALETRVTIRRDGSLVINPVSADDSGLYQCEVSNGIGDPQSASAHLSVEYPAKVTFTPTVQYLPFRLAGVVQCYIKANPPLQYVTWTKDKRLLEPYQTKDIVIMNNGSLLFTRVNQNHQGRYTCTPYNAQGTQGSSGQMEVLVRKPPVFTLEPDPLYQRKVGESVEMHCDAQEAEGTQKPNIQWQRRDGQPMQRNRVRIVGGNITIESLRRTDFGFYQCVASNEVATIVTATQLVVEGTQPHAPYNLSANASEFAVTLTWLPGYSGGPDYKQDYTIWYREAGKSDWLTIPVTPPGSTMVTINRLSPGTTFEFQVIGKNALGDGMLSKVITVRTLDHGIRVNVAPTVKESDNPFNPPEDVLDNTVILFPTDSSGATLVPPIFRPTGPKPGQPRNLTVTEISNGFMITWQAPLERFHLVQYYTIKYRTDGNWKTLNKGQIRSEETSYLVKNLVGGRTYHFRVLANSVRSYESSDEVKFSVPARVKHKAITAGVVGGILFFIVAIILSVCAVKICNKRKRRKQEKAYNMVACRITDSRNGGQPPASVSQVPLKKLGQGRVPGVRGLLRGVVKQLVRPGGGGGSSSDGSGRSRQLGRISRAPDGRFVVASDSSSCSSSDDGGFLALRSRTSWRRPLVRRPSEQFSLRSSFSSGAPWRTPVIATVYTPQPKTPFQASSPASPNFFWTPLSNLFSPAYFSDISSVPQVSSAERTIKSVHERYSQELPSLRAIHEENERVLGGSPRRRSRLPPRHARHARSAPELNQLTQETSPESRSSSSGFGSKNTSQRTGSSGEWRYLPPYRPPPPPPPTIIPPWANHHELTLTSLPSPTHSDLSHNKPLSVDDHYEFDAVFPLSPTPTEMMMMSRGPATLTPTHHRLYHHSKYDNIEARVQAMKEEFHAFRQRQAARRRQTAQLESAC